MIWRELECRKNCGTNNPFKENFAQMIMCMIILALSIYWSCWIFRWINNKLLRGFWPEKDELDQLTIAYGNNFFCHDRWRRIGNCEKMRNGESCLCCPSDSHHPATSCPPPAIQNNHMTDKEYFMHLRWEKIQGVWYTGMNISEVTDSMNNAAVLIKHYLHGLSIKT